MIITLILFKTFNTKQYKNLDAWKFGFAFVKEAYKATTSFPAEEKFGLVSQIWRAAVSISVNIAEGAARKTKKEFLQFLYIAEGALSALGTLIELSFELNFCNEEISKNLLLLLEVISKRIFGLIKKIESEIK